MKYPPKPITQKDVHKGSFHSGERSCLLGHIEKCCPTPQEYERLERQILMAIRDELDAKTFDQITKSVYKQHGTAPGIPYWNDRILTKEQIANVWNRVAATYVDGSAPDEALGHAMVWVTKEGRPMKPEDFDDGHLLNTIRYIKRKKFRTHLLEALEAEASKRGLLPEPKPIKSFEILAEESSDSELELLLSFIDRASIEAPAAPPQVLKCVAPAGFETLARPHRIAGSEPAKGIPVDDVLEIIHEHKKSF